MSICFITGCNKEPEAINYGKDSCAFCKMTIMDRKFGCELISMKGKKIKFDCIECMIDYLQSEDDFIPFKTLVTNYNHPGHFIKAENSFFLHGGEVKSPMGGNICAFNKREDAAFYQKSLNGDILDWSKAIQIKFE